MSMDCHNMAFPSKRFDSTKTVFKFRRFRGPDPLWCSSITKSVSCRRSMQILLSICTSRLKIDFTEIEKPRWSWFQDSWNVYPLFLTSINLFSVQASSSNPVIFSSISCTRYYSKVIFPKPITSRPAFRKICPTSIFEAQQQEPNFVWVTATACSLKE